MNVNRDVLLERLSAVLPGLAKKDGLPQSQCFVFADGEVITFNDRVTIHCPLPPEIRDLTGAVRAGELYKILSKIPTGTILDVTMAESQLLLTASSVKVEIRRDLEIVNKYTSVALPTSFKKCPLKLLKAIASAAFSASTDLSKPILTHVYVSGKHATSCDNKRVTIVTFDAEADTMFVPATVVKDLLAYDPIEYSVGEGWVHWRTKDNVLFSFRSIQGEYPRVDHFFDGSEGWASMSFPTGMLDAVSRVSEALDQEDLYPNILVEVKAGRIVLTGEGPIAKVKERLTTTHQGELSFRIAAEFLEDVIARGAEVRIGDNRLVMETEDKTFRHLACLPKMA